MGELSVYDSRGRALHPEDASNSGEMSMYFEDQVFAMTDQGGTATVEVYLRVKTENQREQVSLRFNTSKTDSVLRACRQAVQRELVEQRGWEIKEPHRPGPEDVFWYGIWSNTETAEYSPVELFKDTQHGLGLDGVEADLLDDVVADHSSPNVHLSASDYEQIGQALKLFQGEDYTITVSRPRRSPPDYSDIHFTPAKNQQTRFTLDSSTETVLENRKKQWWKQRQEQTLQGLVDSLEQLDNLGAERSLVKTRLNDGLEQTYSELTVAEDQLISEPEPTVRAKQSDPVDKTDLRGSRWSGESRKMVVAVVIAIFLLLVAGIVGIVVWGMPVLF